MIIIMCWALCKLERKISQRGRNEFWKQIIIIQCNNAFVKRGVYKIGESKEGMKRR